MQSQIQQFLLGQQTLEMELAWDLRDVFDTEEQLIGPLRHLVSSLTAQ